MALTKAHNRIIEGVSVNVLDFGAVADGVTDSSSAFQAAIDSLPARGGNVLVPRGEYLLASGILLDKAGSISLLGEGGMGYNANASTRLYFTGTGPCVTIGSASATNHNGKHLSKLYIEGNNSAGQIGIKVLRNNSNFFEMVRINEMLGAGSIGFEFDGTGDATIINELLQCGIRKVTTGLKLTKSTSVRVNGGYWNAVGGSVGIDCISDDTFIAEGVNFDGWPVAIETANAAAEFRGIRVVGCRFEGNALGINLGALVSVATCSANYFNNGGSGTSIVVDAGAGNIKLNGNVVHNITAGVGAFIVDDDWNAEGTDAEKFEADIFAGRGLSTIPMTGLATAVAGTGAVTQNPASLSITTGATAASTALARTGADVGWSAGKAVNVINWSKKVIVSFRVSRVSAGSANAKFRFSIGKSTGDGIGDLSSKGIGVTFNRFQPIAAVHDGSSLTTANIEAFNLDVATHDFRIVSLGDGTVRFYLNGALKATLTGGPTGDSTAGDTVLQIEADNGADAVANAILTHDVRVYVEQ